MAGPQAPSKSGQTSSSGQLVVALVVSTLIGVGGGGFLGLTLGAEPPAAAGATVADKPAESAAPSHAEKAEKGHGGHGGGEGAGKDEAPQVKMRLKELPPIVTNLAPPETGWVRLQAAIVYDSAAIPQPDILISE
ncbi:MAG: flagellar basal body-associated protein FliL, partial [Sphingopyxis terrae]